MGDWVPLAAARSEVAAVGPICGVERTLSRQMSAVHQKPVVICSLP